VNVDLDDDDEELIAKDLEVMVMLRRMMTFSCIPFHPSSSRSHRCLLHTLPTRRSCSPRQNVGSQNAENNTQARSSEEGSQGSVMSDLHRRA
jgi:hypothetical protein